MVQRTEDGMVRRFVWKVENPRDLGWREEGNEVSLEVSQCFVLQQRKRSKTHLSVRVRYAAGGLKG